MNIYWCHEKHEYSGLYIVAATRGWAKKIYADEVECSMLKVRTNIVKRGVTEQFEGEIEFGSPLLEKYGLHYDDDEDEWED